MLKRDAKAKNAESTNATTNIHSSTPRVSPQSAWSKFASKSSLIVSKVVFSRSVDPKTFLYAMFLKVIFHSEQRKLPLFLKTRRKVTPCGVRFSSVWAGRPARPLPRPSANQNVPSSSRDLKTGALIKGEIANVERQSREVLSVRSMASRETGSEGQRRGT